MANGLRTVRVVTADESLLASARAAAKALQGWDFAHVPGTRVPLASKEDAGRVLKLIEALEDNDDVQNVYANYDIPDEWMGA